MGKAFAHRIKEKNLESEIETHNKKGRTVFALVWIKEKNLESEIETYGVGHSNDWLYTDQREESRVRD